MNARQKNLRLGKELLSWVAPDYHPYERGLIWHIAFCAVMFGSAIFFLLWDPQWGWVSAFAFCFVAAVYFWIHKDDNTVHEIKIFENAIQVDEKHIKGWDIFQGYWILEDMHARLLILEYKAKRSDRVVLQLDEMTTKKVKKSMEKTRLEEIPKKEQEEALTQLWIRALKL